MPVVELNGFVIWVSHCSPSQDQTLALKAHTTLPTGRLANRLRHRTEDFFSNAVGSMLRMKPNHFAASAYDLIDQVRFSSARPDQRLASVDHERVRLRVHGNEEPLALTPERGRAPAKSLTVAKSGAGDCASNLDRNETFLGRLNGGAADTGSEPIAFVVAAEESLRCCANFTEKQQQVTIFFVAIEHVGLSARWEEELETAFANANAFSRSTTGTWVRHS